MTDITPETRADMFRRGYVYKSGSNTGNGLKKVVKQDGLYPDSQLDFDVPAYDCHKKMGLLK
jgi:hypothetical protein